MLKRDQIFFFEKKSVPQDRTVDGTRVGGELTGGSTHGPEPCTA